MHNNSRISTLNDMDGDVERAGQSHNLRLAAPCRGVTHRRAVVVELRAVHHAGVERAGAVLALGGRQEGEKVVRVGVYEVGSGGADGGVGGLLGGYNPEQRELIGDGGEEAVAVWVYLWNGMTKCDMVSRLKKRMFGYGRTSWTWSPRLLAVLVI